MLLGLTVNTTDIINHIAGLKQDKKLVKTLSVDSSTIDLATGWKYRLINSMGALLGAPSHTWEMACTIIGKASDCIGLESKCCIISSASL